MGPDADRDKLCREITKTYYQASCIIVWEHCHLYIQFVCGLLEGAPCHYQFVASCPIH